MTQNSVDAARHASFYDSEKIDTRVGRVIGIESFPEGRYSTHIIEIDFGEEQGIEKSLARLAPNHDGPELVNTCNRLVQSLGAIAWGTCNRLGDAIPWGTYTCNRWGRLGDGWLGGGGLAISCMSPGGRVSPGGPPPPHQPIFAARVWVGAV